MTSEIEAKIRELERRACHGSPANTTLARPGTGPRKGLWHLTIASPMGGVIAYGKTILIALDDAERKLAGR